MDTITLPQILFTVQDLTTLAGLVVAVYVIVPIIKEPIKALAQEISGSGGGDWTIRPVPLLIALSIPLAGPLCNADIRKSCCKANCWRNAT
jgi:hypothetical protein